MPIDPTALVLEVCVENAADALAAQDAGADRIELCADLQLEGLTPSPKVVEETLAAVRIPVHVMARPRAGDFRYAEAEFTELLDGIRTLSRLGAHGVVFGVLTSDCTIDESRTRAVVEAAGPLGTTFHRAFDAVADPGLALETLVACGVTRVLTSGQAASAREGIASLRELRRRAAGRLGVIACGRLRADSIGEVIRDTGLREFHFAPLRRTVNPAAPHPFTFDAEILRATISAARRAHLLVAQRGTS